MSIDLTQYERGAPFNGDVDAALAALRERLAVAQLSQIVHRQRLVIVLEGAEGSGKTAVLKELAAVLDPRFTSVCTILPDRRRHSEGHWLARFWAGLPEAGHSTFFYHSWYKRVLEDRVLGLVAEKDWRRAYDEINEFEVQQRDYGTVIVKLFLHVTEATQAERIAVVEADPWKSLMMGPSDLRESSARAAYRNAVQDMFAQNHTRWSPWIVVDSNNSEATKAEALGAIADAMEKAFPSAPPQERDSVVSFKASERA